MENREILIANTRTQKRSKITTNATTLGELKAAMDMEGIDYIGLDFTEGISKTQLLADDAQLPQNVMYKGQPTNNLVILLTNTKKKIASGALSRKEVYEIIKNHNLQDGIKAAFGKNYTLVTTVDLQAFVDKALAQGKDASSEVDLDSEVNKPEHKDAEKVETEPVAPANDNLRKPDLAVISESIVEYVDTLVFADILTAHDVRILAKRLNRIAEVNGPADPVGTTNGDITDSDIDDMLSDLGI